jgi:pimeloyl-ACP methyl ester carboxylesterase
VEDLSRRFRDARVAVIEKAGHAMQLDQPAAVTAAIRAFL